MLCVVRHYASWDTECVRSWKLEASVNGQVWVALKEHNDDKSLNGKGSSATWQIPTLDPAHIAHLLTSQALNSAADADDAGGASPSAAAAVGGSNGSFPPPLAFRCFRVVMTAPNSNNHMYLPLSGFELYGTMYVAGVELFTTPPPPNPNPAPLSAPLSGGSVSASGSGAASASVGSLRRPASSNDLPAAAPAIYKPASDFDENGIIYQLATAGRTRTWVNPGKTGAVRGRKSAGLN